MSATDNDVELTRSPKQPVWARLYLPLISLAVSLLITVAILPSSLNLPQSNPSETPEYAPIPPEDDSPAITSGGFSSLGLTSSNTLRTRIQQGPPPETPPGRPPPSQQKECTRGLQTEDPNSPKCQDFFEGDNGGSTWQGVTGNEITVLIYNQVGRIIDQGQGQVQDTPSAGTYCDVEIMDCDEPGEEGYGETDDDPHMWLKIANAYSRYFNDRYQTYKRYVHFYYYWSNADSPPTRKADAVDNWERLKPFAVMNKTWWGGYNEEYAQQMAAFDIMVFSPSDSPLSRSFFNAPDLASKVWSYIPDVENWADMYIGYICNKVVGTKVNHAGPAFQGPDGQGEDRRYALMYTTDPAYGNLQHFAQLVKDALAKPQCGSIYKPGVTPEVTFPYAGWYVDNRSEAQTYGTTNVAKLSGAYDGRGANTILWLGGAEAKTTVAASSRNYYPEWVVAGDGDLDGLGYARSQAQDVWKYAWVQTYQLRVDSREENHGYQAYKDADPDGTDYNWAITFYRDFFMMFQSIQVAGPNLNPASVDAGLHAIQRKESTSAYVSACYFLPGDYSCQKDGTEYYYDSDTVASDGSRGVYRMVRDGFRYARDRWHTARGAGIDVHGYFTLDDDPSAYTGQGRAINPNP